MPQRARLPCSSSRRSVAVEVGLHAADGEHVEHALAAATHDVDQLVAVAQHHVVAADHEVGRGDVGVDVLAQVLERLAHGLELDAGVEQALDDPQLEQVAVAVQPPAAAAGGVGERRRIRSVRAQ